MAAQLNFLPRGEVLSNGLAGLDHTFFQFPGLLRLHREHLQTHSDLDLVTLDHVEPTPGVRVFNDLRPGDPRLTAILAGATVFAFPSEMDLSPNAVLEAMAAGVPVVALRVGAVGELVEHGVTGLLVEPHDDRALVAAIASLLSDPDRARQMGDAARARVRERFDARVSTASLLDVLAEARDRHGRIVRAGATDPRSRVGNCERKSS